jgi:hypothetical protein
MPNSLGGKDSSRIDLLRQREAAVIGEALTGHARQSPDFRLMLKQVLGTAELRESDRAFLALKGWL